MSKGGNAIVLETTPELCVKRTGLSLMARLDPPQTSRLLVLAWILCDGKPVMSHGH